MNIFIFGGSFNPVHNGHIKLLSEVVKEFSPDKILIIPNAIPPHKENKDFVSDEDRIAMCAAAFKDFETAEICDYEIKCADVSYTINTLTYLKTIYPDDEFFFIMGGDMLLSFHEWKEYKKLLLMTTIIAAAREENEYEALADKKRELEEYGGRIILLKAEPYVVSSSKIRSLIKQGKDFSCYLPERVVKYIMDKKMYLE